MRIQCPFMAVCTMLLCLGAVGAVTDPSASISVDGSQSIPQQEIRFENEQFNTSALKIADPDDTITANVNVRRDEVYRVYIYDTEENIVDDRRGTTDASFEFQLDTTNYPAGTYLMAVVQDGNYLAVHPLLVRSYRVSVDAPSEATQGSTVHVSANVEHARGRTLDHVEFVVTDGSERVRHRAQKTTAGTYEADIDLSGLPAGEYEVYATVRANNTAYGENEFLGVNSGHRLSIRAPQTTSQPDQQQPTEQTVTSETPSVTGPLSPTETAQTERPDASDRQTPTSREGSDSVISPRNGTTSPSDAVGQPGFGPGLAVIALAGFMFILARR